MDLEYTFTMMGVIIMGVGRMNDERHGFGGYINANRSRYLEYWKDDLKDGVCFNIHDIDNYYIGQLKDNKEEGQGSWNWPNGDIYTGEWKNGKMSGTGVYEWFDDRIYTSDYFNGKVHGLWSVFLA